MPKIQNFDNWSEDAQWAIAHLITMVPDDIFQRAGDGRPNVDIKIEGYIVEDLQPFFEDLMRAFRSEIKKQVASGILQRFDSVSDLWYDLFQNSRQALKDELHKTFGVDWHCDDEIYHDWTRDHTES